MIEWWLLLVSALSLSLLFFSFIYVIGIVWRVEQELDVAYKFLAGAVFFFLLSEMLDILPVSQDTVIGATWFRGAKLLAALCLFLGMFFMRDLVRKLDGEKKSKE